MAALTAPMVWGEPDSKGRGAYNTPFLLENGHAVQVTARRAGAHQARHTTLSQNLPRQTKLKPSACYAILGALALADSALGAALKHGPTTLVRPAVVAVAAAAVQTRKTLLPVWSRKHAACRSTPLTSRTRKPKSEEACNSTAARWLS